MRYVVLDPACGSGNFLYVAYRELRRLEAELRRRAADMRRSAGLREQETLAVHFPLTNMRGIEADPFAVSLARLSLWMGHKLAVDELDIDERVLPLADLSGIQRADALRIAWPHAVPRTRLRPDTRLDPGGLHVESHGGSDGGRRGRSLQRT